MMKLNNTTLDIIEVIHHHESYIKKIKFDPFLQKRKTNDMISKILLYFNKNNVTTEKKLLSYIKNIPLEEIERRWNDRDGFKNSKYMSNIRKSLRILENCKALSCTSINVKNWIMFKWSFTKEAWKNQFNYCKCNLIEEIENKKKRFEDDILFICSKKCTNRVYSMIVIEELQNKCENGHTLIPINKKEYIEAFNDDIFFLKQLQFPHKSIIMVEKKETLIFIKQREVYENVYEIKK